MPNIVLYTFLINHFLKMGEFKYAFRLIDLMFRSQIEADLVLHIAWISGVCRNIFGTKKRWYMTNRMSTRARKLLFNLLHQKVSLPGEDFLVFLLVLLGNKRFSIEAHAENKRTGFMPNPYLHNVTVSGFCWVNLIEDAYHQLRLMQEEALLPNEVTFTILIGANGRAGEIDRTIGLFNRMNADGCSTSGRCTYNTFLKSLCRSGRELDALSLVHTTSKRGFFPNRLAYEKSHHYFCAGHMSIPAFRIFE